MGFLSFSYVVGPSESCRCRNHVGDRCKAAKNSGGDSNLKSVQDRDVDQEGTQETETYRNKEKTSFSGNSTAPTNYSE